MEQESYLVFTIDGRRLALPCASIIRVAAAAELLDLPDAPPCTRGVANFGGVPVPVMDIRAHFRNDLPEMELSDYFVFFRSGSHICALLTDSVEGVHLLSPGATVLHSRTGDKIERTVLVAYEPDEDIGILICSPEDILTLTDEEFHSIGSVLSSEREAP